MAIRGRCQPFSRLASLFCRYRWLGIVLYAGPVISSPYFRGRGTRNSTCNSGHHLTWEQKHLDQNLPLLLQRKPPRPPLLSPVRFVACGQRRSRCCGFRAAVDTGPTAARRIEAPSAGVVPVGTLQADSGLDGQSEAGVIPAFESPSETTRGHWFGGSGTLPTGAKRQLP